MEIVEDSSPNEPRDRPRPCSVFVNNLHLAVTREEMIDMFEEYGSVQDVTIVRREEFTTHKFGYVILDSVESSRLAIQELNGTPVRGLRLRVEPCFEKAAPMFGPGGNNRSGSWNRRNNGGQYRRGHSYRQYNRRNGYVGGLSDGYRHPSRNNGSYGNGCNSRNGQWNEKRRPPSSWHDFRDFPVRNVEMSPLDEHLGSSDDGLGLDEGRPQTAIQLRGRHPVLWPPHSKSEADEDTEESMGVLDLLRKLHGDAVVADFHKLFAHDPSGRLLSPGEVQREDEAGYSSARDDLPVKIGPSERGTEEDTTRQKGGGDLFLVNASTFSMEQQQHEINARQDGSNENELSEEAELMKKDQIWEGVAHDDSNGKDVGTESDVFEGDANMGSRKQDGGVIVDETRQGAPQKDNAGQEGKNQDELSECATHDGDAGPDGNQDELPEYATHGGNADQGDRTQDELFVCDTHEGIVCQEYGKQDELSYCTTHGGSVGEENEERDEIYERATREGKAGQEDGKHDEVFECSTHEDNAGQGDKNHDELSESATQDSSVDQEDEERGELPECTTREGKAGQEDGKHDEAFECSTHEDNAGQQGQVEQEGFIQNGPTSSRIQQHTSNTEQEDTTGTTSNDFSLLAEAAGSHAERHVVTVPKSNPRDLEADISSLVEYLKTLANQCNALNKTTWSIDKSLKAAEAPASHVDHEQVDRVEKRPDGDATPSGDSVPVEAFTPSVAERNARTSCSEK